MNWKSFIATVVGIVLGTFVLILLILAGTYILTRPETPVAQVPSVVEQGLNSNESNSTHIDENETNSNESSSIVAQPVAEQNPLTGTGEPCNEYTVDLGSIGKYHAVYDSNFDVCTLGIWETSMLREGTGLYAWKESAIAVTFTMPFDGTVNNSAGHIEVDGEIWILGNPAVDPVDNVPFVPAGTTVSIWTDGPNDSAGFQLWENKD